MIIRVFEKTVEEMLEELLKKWKTVWKSRERCVSAYDSRIFGRETRRNIKRSKRKVWVKRKKVTSYERSIFTTHSIDVI